MVIYLRAKGRTSPPAKTIGHRESINPALAVLKLVAKYLVPTIYSNMQQKKCPIVNRQKIAKKPDLTGKRGTGGEVERFFQVGEKSLKKRTKDSFNLLINPDYDSSWNLVDDREDIGIHDPGGAI